MCYRFAYGDVESVQSKYKVQLSQDALDRLGDPLNVYPSEYAPIIIKNQESDVLIADTFKWGLIPFWAKDEKIGRKLFNARIETLNQKPSFKDSYQKHRCLVPAIGFYETNHSKKENKPHFFSPRDKKLLSFAGLYSQWNGITTFTIITVPADKYVKPIHDRMPFILSGNEEKIWLNSGDNPLILKKLLTPDYSLT